LAHRRWRACLAARSHTAKGVLAAGQPTSLQGSVAPGLVGDPFPPRHPSVRAAQLLCDHTAPQLHPGLLPHGHGRSSTHGAECRFPGSLRRQTGPMQPTPVPPRDFNSPRESQHRLAVRMIGPTRTYPCLLEPIRPSIYQTHRSEARLEKKEEQAVPEDWHGTPG